MTVISNIVRESTFNSYVMFATDSEKDLMTSSYKLVTPSKATKEEKTRIPALKTENVYLLKGISEEKEDLVFHLNPILR